MQCQQLSWKGRTCGFVLPCLKITAQLSELVLHVAIPAESDSIPLPKALTLRHSGAGSGCRGIVVPLSWHCTNPMWGHRFPVFSAGASTAQAGAVVPQPPGLGRGLRCPVKPGGEPCNAPAVGAALCSPTLTSQRRIPAGLRRGRGREGQAAPRGARSLGPCRGLAGVLQPGAVILGMPPLFWGCPRSSLAGLTRPC